MVKRFRFLGLVATMLFFMFFLMPLKSEAVPKQVQVKVTKDNATSKFNIKLTWTYTTGENLYVSTDGQTWTQITIGTPTNGAEYSITDSTQRPSHAIVYYEVRDASNNKKRVNVFPGTGDNYANQHGNYDKNTNTCVNCHATHKAEGALLLKGNTIGALCDTCHSAAVSGGVGSRYMTDIGGVQAADGKYLQALGGLFGRPTSDASDISSPNSLSAGNVNSTNITLITDEVWKEYKVGSESLTNSTSIHTMEATNLVAPGDSSPTRDMYCTSCHQGHPNDNNYRLLKSAINDTSIGEIEAYAVSNGTVQTDAKSGMKVVETARYIKGLNEFCAQCHSVLKVGSGAATTTPTTIDGKAHYLHPVGEDLTYTPANGGSQTTLTTTLPVSTENKILCSTCHFAHGTPVADNSTQASNYINGHNSSMLKRRANQAICQDCHQK